MREFDFYIVPTPIGNIKDITLRALEVLKAVDIIACEDSRVTQKLLNHYDIKTKCISYHKYNEKQRVDEILKILSEGRKVALVSDAGTPLISDPGSVLVKALKENNISYTALPGACALTTFLSAVAREDEFFTFVGFLPKSESQIEKILTKYRNSDIVFYESPLRIKKTLSVVKKIRSAAKIVFGRELTKVFEEFSDTLTVEKGEFVCMVCREVENEGGDFACEIAALKKKGFGAKDIATIISTLYNVNKNKIYNLVR